MGLTKTAPATLINIPTPGAGVNFAYTLTAPARLKSVFLTYSADSSAHNRYLSLTAGNYPGFWECPLNATAITASNVFNLIGWPTAPLAAAPGGLYYTAPLPDIVLPSGAIISSAGMPLSTADQWTLINLGLEPA